MDNYTWDLTIKQNPTQPNKYIDTSNSVVLESAKLQPVEELNMKQLNIDNTHYSASSNGEAKTSSKESITVQVSAEKADSKAVKQQVSVRQSLYESF